MFRANILHSTSSPHPWSVGEALERLARRVRRKEGEVRGLAHVLEAVEQLDQDALEGPAEVPVEDAVDHRVRRGIGVAQPGDPLNSELHSTPGALTWNTWMGKKLGISARQMFTTKKGSQQSRNVPMITPSVNLQHNHQ